MLNERWGEVGKEKPLGMDCTLRMQWFSNDSNGKNNIGLFFAVFKVPVIFIL